MRVLKPKTIFQPPDNLPSFNLPPSPLLHRALKPNNILLAATITGEPSLQPYLTRFGMPAAINHSGTLTVTGTFGYSAPEQFYNRAIPASDLYSLGAVLLYLATGQSPTSYLEPKQEQKQKSTRVLRVR